MKNFQNTSPKRLVVGITGASGVILGIRLLEILKNSDVETHLVLSPAARITINQETDWKINDVLSLSRENHNHNDIGAKIASGSFLTIGMVVIPCSIKTLSAVANSYANDSLSRAADVTLKEGRPLILVLRESPLHHGHIKLMKLASEAGAIIYPPVPHFYSKPKTIDDMINNIVGRVLLRIGIENNKFFQWEGLGK